LRKSFDPKTTHRSMCFSPELIKNDPIWGYLWCESGCVCLKYLTHGWHLSKSVKFTDLYHNTSLFSELPAIFCFLIPFFVYMVFLSVIIWWIWRMDNTNNVILLPSPHKTLRYIFLHPYFKNHSFSMCIYHRFCPHKFRIWRMDYISSSKCSHLHHNTLGFSTPPLFWFLLIFFQYIWCFSVWFCDESGAWITCNSIQNIRESPQKHSSSIFSPVILIKWHSDSVFMYPLPETWRIDDIFVCVFCVFFMYFHHVFYVSFYVLFISFFLVVEFAKTGAVVISASLDGTVRAYDLVRYKNFRTMTTPKPVQVWYISCITLQTS